MTTKAPSNEASNEARVNARFAMAMSMQTQRLSLRLRDQYDAVWNHELLGEHEGGTTESVQDVRVRLAEQRIQALGSGIGLLTIRRRVDDEPLGYCGLIVGRCSLDEREIACELLRRFHGSGYATEAAQAVVDAAFATGRKRIWSTVGHGTSRRCGSWTNLVFDATTRPSTIAAGDWCTWSGMLQVANHRFDGVVPSSAVAASAD